MKPSPPSDLLTDRYRSLTLSLQNVIPQQLLDQYLSMTDPARAQTVDTEIAKHCAFSLPGVALTLGRQNWHCLKDTYETLASDVQVGRRWVFNTRKKYIKQARDVSLTLLHFITWQSSCRSFSNCISWWVNIKCIFSVSNVQALSHLPSFSGRCDARWRSPSTSWRLSWGISWQQPTWCPSSTASSKTWMKFASVCLNTSMTSSRWV